MRLVIVHYHIFKNAGSTVEEILRHSFGERFATLETPAGDGLIPNADMLRFLDARPALRAFSSHQIRHPLPQAPGCLFFDVCFLRDPIDRIRSIYTYFRQKPNPADPMSELANRAGLGDFVSGMIRDFPLFVKNVQVNLLACAGDSDEPEPRDLHLATERMLATSFLGVVDCFGQSVAAGAYALRRVFPELDCDRPPANVSDGLHGTVASRCEKLRQACAPGDYEELLRLNALDRELVDRARAEVLRRFAQVPEPAVPPPKAESRAAAPTGFLAGARRLLDLARYRRELFDSGFYLRKYPDVAAARMNPLFHYLRHGAAEDRKPHPLFDPAYYRSACREYPANGREPLWHFLRSRAQAASPHPLFDCEAYLAAHPGVAARRINPLVDYQRHPAASPNGPMPAEPAPVARLEIQDVPVTVVCRDASFAASTPEERRAVYDAWKRREANVALVWPLPSGRVDWLAEPQQLPFLRAVRLDQIRAQVG
jgi:hypothetical protein